LGEVKMARSLKFERCDLKIQIRGCNLSILSKKTMRESILAASTPMHAIANEPIYHSSIIKVGSKPKYSLSKTNLKLFNTNLKL
jgi:hypothetical protein